MDKFKDGDKAIFEIKGLGKEEVEIVTFNDELCIYDPNEGYYPLRFIEERDYMILTKKEDKQ